MLKHYKVIEIIFILFSKFLYFISILAKCFPLHFGFFFLNHKVLGRWSHVQDLNVACMVKQPIGGSCQEGRVPA